MENKEMYLQAVGKIIDILIKINDFSARKVAEELEISKSQVLNYIKGLSVPEKEHIQKICKMFDIKEDLFYYFVSYYESLSNYEDRDRFKLTISYILELTFNNKELKPKNKFPFLDEEEPVIKEDGSYEKFISAGKNLRNKPF